MEDIYSFRGEFAFLSNFWQLSWQAPQLPEVKAMLVREELKRDA